jgi:hypothetical protein
MGIICTSGSPAGRTLADDLQTEGARIHDGLRVHDGPTCSVVEEGSQDLDQGPERLASMQFCAIGAVEEDDVYCGVEVFLHSIAQEIAQFHTELDAAGVPQAVNDSRVTALPGDMAVVHAAGVPQAVTDLWKTDSLVQMQQDEKLEKASLFTQLQPLLLPRLAQDRFTWDEAAPMLSKIHLDILRTAVATANVQPVLAKLRYANNSRSLFFMYSSLLTLLRFSGPRCTRCPR